MSAEATMIWEEVLTALRSNTECEDYENWIVPARPDSFDGNSLTISVPTSIYRESINHQFRHQIEKLLHTITEKEINLIIKTESESRPIKEKTESTYPTGLNIRFTFESFIVGPSNDLCYTASQAVSENPGKRYNPLFIYGGVGLGKTHLLNAIGNQALEAHPHLRVLYVTSENFINDLINAIMHKSYTEFRRLYRQVDLLLIDDIQFIAGKESTQAEFFHTFNTLINTQKQIVISADRSPSEIEGLEHRIISRLSGGLTADIQPPDIETRLAIIEKKCRFYGYTITSDVAMLIAEKVTSNIRIIEGALNSLFAYAQLIHEPINMEVAERAIKNIISAPTKPITSHEIIEKVAQFFNININEIVGKSRQSSVMLPRHIAIYLCRKYTTSSLTELGKVFRRDHTTILHSLEKIEDTLPEDLQLRTNLEKIKKSLL